MTTGAMNPLYMCRTTTACFGTAAARRKTWSTAQTSVWPCSQVTDLQVAGVARVVLDPLVPVIPGFGAAVIALRCAA